MIYSCEGTYSFIGNGVGKGKQITYAEAWKGMFINYVANKSFQDLKDHSQLQRSHAHQLRDIQL